MQIVHDGRDYSEYPIGTKIHTEGGSFYLRTGVGWKWSTNGITYAKPFGNDLTVLVDIPIHEYDRIVELENKNKIYRGIIKEHLAFFASEGYLDQWESLHDLLKQLKEWRD